MMTDAPDPGLTDLIAAHREEAATDPAFEYWPRVQRAIQATVVSRADAEWQWPTCHKRRCQCQNDIGFVFRMFIKAVEDTVLTEMLCGAISDPDLGTEEES